LALLYSLNLHLQAVTGCHDAAAALASFRVAAKQHPENSLAQYLLAEELSNQAPGLTSPTFTESVSAAKSAIALEPGLVAAHDLFADLYLRAELNDLALAESQQALKLDPNDEQALYQQIFALRKTDRKAEVAVLVNRMMAVRQEKANGSTQRNYRLVESAQP